MKDPIERQDIIKELESWLKVEGYSEGELNIIKAVLYELQSLPSAQPEYEPAKLEDFAKTMSANTLYSFMAWHGEGLELMERHGFVICKKTM